MRYVTRMCIIFLLNRAHRFLNWCKLNNFHKHFKSIKSFWTCFAKKENSFNDLIVQKIRVGPLNKWSATNGEQWAWIQDRYCWSHRRRHVITIRIQIQQTDVGDGFAYVPPRRYKLITIQPRKCQRPLTVIIWRLQHDDFLRLLGIDVDSIIYILCLKEYIKIN